MIDLNLPLRAVQFFLTIISLGLNGYQVNKFSGNTINGDPPSEVNFLLFVSIWTLLVLPYLALAPSMFPRFANKFAIFGLDVLTMLFWFAGFIALAVHRDEDLTCVGRLCSTMTAACVFGAFEWLAFTVTSVLAALGIWQARGSSGGKPAASMGVNPGGAGVATA